MLRLCTCRYAVQLTHLLLLLLLLLLLVLHAFCRPSANRRCIR
jgi:hypothetical protein